MRLHWRRSLHGAGKRKKNSYVPFISSIGSFLVLATYWAFYIRPVYYPSGDEFALLVASAKMFKPSIAAWFFNGFSQYFIAYPGLSLPSTDFIRPVANASYYLNSLIFGSHWVYYLLFNYAVQAGLVFVATLLAQNVFLLSRRLCTIVAVMVFLSPAFGWQAIYYPSFIFDLLAALFVLLAFYELWKERYVSAWILLTLAVFTKESALFAPAAVALAVWLPARKHVGILRQVACSVLWMLPLFAWVTVRHLAFHGNSGIYVLRSFTLHKQFLNVVHGVLAWPFGTRSIEQSPNYRLLFFPLNATFWSGGLYLLYRSVSSAHSVVTNSEIREVPIHRDARNAFSALLLFTACATLMPVFLNLPQRFGGSFYPLFALLLVVVVQITWGAVRRGVAVAIGVSLIMAVYQRIIEPISLAETTAEWTLARSYVSTLHASSARNLLVINDASGGFTTSEIITRFAGFHGTLIRSNNINSLSIAQCSGQPQIDSIKHGDQLQIVSLLAPPCGFYAFDGITPEAVRAAKNGLVQRTNNQVVLGVLPPSFVPRLPAGDPVLYGKLTVEVTGPSAGREIIVPNLKKLSYEDIR